MRHSSPMIGAGSAQPARNTTAVRAWPLGRFAFLAVGLAAAGALHAADMPVGHPPVASQISAADLTFFETKIRPVLSEHCYKCHSKEADKVRGGLLIDSREAILHGGNSGPSIVPGK